MLKQYTRQTFNKENLHFSLAFMLGYAIFYFVDFAFLPMTNNNTFYTYSFVIVSFAIGMSLYIILLFVVEKIKDFIISKII